MPRFPVANRPCLKTLAGSSAIAWLLMISPVWATCQFLSEPQHFNTQTDGDLVIIGGQRHQPYRVIVPGNNPSTLEDIRTCVTDALATRSRLGSYILVGSFARRGPAEDLGRRLRAAGYRARTIYRR